MNERGLTTVLKGIYAFVMKRIDALSKQIEKAQSSAEKANSAAETAQAAAETARQAARDANTNANRKVSSVNGKTGAVELAASDVGAISDSDGSVQNAHLASGAVTTDKLAEAERMTSANIVGALGYEPEEKSGEWELLNEITTTADSTGTVYITKDSDGNSIKATSLLMIVTAPDSMSEVLSCGIWARYWTNSNTENTVYFWHGLTTKGYPGKKYVTLHGTVAEATSVQFTTGGSASSATNFGLDAKILTGFSVGGANIPSATKFTVYGIRA